MGGARSRVTNKPARVGYVAFMAAAELWQGPVQVMLAKAQDTIPGPDAMSGGTVWELKFDGYRAVLRVTAAELWSRNGSDLSRIFPELIEAAEADLPAGDRCRPDARGWIKIKSRPALTA